MFKTFKSAKIRNLLLKEITVFLNSYKTCRVLYSGCIIQNKERQKNNIQHCTRAQKAQLRHLHSLKTLISVNTTQNMGLVYLNLITIATNQILKKPTVTNYEIKPSGAHSPPKTSSVATLRRYVKNSKA